MSTQDYTVVGLLSYGSASKVGSKLTPRGATDEPEHGSASWMRYREMQLRRSRSRLPELVPGTLLSDQARTRGRSSG
jgi:hypothetical protein